jgi:cyclophilin family peptidyl-prolyl cis-trans isomerase
MCRNPATRLIPVLATALLVAGCVGGTARETVPPVPSIGPSSSPSGGSSAAASPDASHDAGAAYPAGCPKSQPAALAAGQTRMLTIATAKGDIVINVEGSLSPIAAGDFVALAACGYYDGVIFHRLVPSFLIQGGDGTYGRQPEINPDFVGFGGAPYTIKDEPVTGTYLRATVAMARTNKPDSVTSQFFIVLSDDAQKTLAAAGANNYQIVGRVTSGMNVVDAIAAGPSSGQPDYLATNPVTMTKVTVAKP